MNSANVRCPECSYDKPRNMGTHLFFVHGYSKNKISEWRMNLKADILSRSPTVYDIFRCSFCPKTYRRQNSCRAHERVVHCVSSNMRQKCVPCPVKNCVFSTTALLDLCAHANESHSEMGDFTIREARFENLTLFQAWRLQYEENTQTVLATESVNSNAAAGTTLRYLRCAQLEAQIRKLRNQMKHAVARGNQGRQRHPASEFDDEEDDVREDQEQEDVGTSPSALNSPSRLIRKRKFDEATGSGRPEKHEGFVCMQEKKEEELNEDDGDNEEEEEIDVEQVDEQAPRLMRASSAHRDDVDGEDAADELHHDDDDEQQPEVQQQHEQMKAQQMKMNSRHCTAHMRVLVLGTGAVHVEYCVSHLGHDVFPIPPASSRFTDGRERTKIIRPMAKIPREVEEDIERAKKRRKGRRETEHRWRTERRMRTERDEFAQLCNRYDDIGANVELYEAEDLYDEDELPVEEVIEEEIVEHNVMIEAGPDEKKE